MNFVELSALVLSVISVSVAVVLYVVSTKRNQRTYEEISKMRQDLLKSLDNMQQELSKKVGATTFHQLASLTDLLKETQEEVNKKFETISEEQRQSQQSLPQQTPPKPAPQQIQQQPQKPQPKPQPFQEIRSDFAPNLPEMNSSDALPVIPTDEFTSAVRLICNPSGSAGRTRGQAKVIIAISKEETLEGRERISQSFLQKAEAEFGDNIENYFNMLDELTDDLLEHKLLEEACPYVLRAFKLTLHNPQSDPFRRMLGRIKSLAEQLVEIKKFDAADELYQQSLASMEKLKDPPKKAIIGLLRKTGTLCAQIEDYEKSEAALRRALRITEVLFGEEHPETLNLLMQLGHLIRKAGHFEETEHIYKRVLEIRYKILGSEHPDIVESLMELAKLSSLQNNKVESEIYRESAIETAKAIYGEDSPNVSELVKAFNESPRQASF
ncbi:tetratricopeptide repeat protein [bacterium]|nr:tetratricopeptide repeat protein [bacterium]QQR57532.1 MAG: tetratricopeptide repeat protein [Candidatus Melainabacteria bacterium]